ncbi:unnamed protein product [Acanthoscelides obtectus]|uniref:BZIP domain-containing protein n=1 Tax=Acanthoscelides obtectus TaxID=200917 RepID=A0A9P0MHM0_ACAOB|nr:unnamed protein product [Acanthoscelides obtectus]CAK1630778.1 Cyclic AMP-dependent transcription factor ATF-6 alpha [Acanthoscelides obtectus]
MLTTEDFIIQDYGFKSSPESCSDNSFSTDCLDVASDEDFLTQLSSDLDIPLLLNPGEDEMNMLNAFFDKSPEEIMSDIKSPVFAREGSLEKEIDELQGVDISRCGLEAFSNLQSNIKVEPTSSDSASNKSKSPSPDTKITIKSELEIKSPPSSPESMVTTISQIPAKNIIYTQPVQLVQSSLKQLPPKRVPIVPKPPYTVPFKKDNIVVINAPVPIPVTTTSTNMLFLDNVPQITTSNSQTSRVPVTVPSGHNIVGIDPKILKRQQRKIRNRESASLSRKRKKDYVTQLEDQIKILSDENKKLKEENAYLKKRLETYEVVNENSSKSVKPGLFLCICLLVLGVNTSILRNPFSTKTELDTVQSRTNIIDHHGRSLLWTDEESNTIKNDTTNFSPLFMCPATINQTETARLVSELERWIGKPDNLSMKNATIFDRSLKQKLRKKRLKLDGTLMPMYKRYRYKEDNLVNPSVKNEIQVFSLRPKQTYSEFFEAINRQDDTYYVVSFTDQHMLLPALNHNKTRRPKMSLIMPSVLPNGKLISLFIGCKKVLRHYCF